MTWKNSVRYGESMIPDEMRQQTSLPTLNEFHDWLTTAERQVLPKSPVGQAIGYVLPRWDGFTRYCENGALSIDNNLSERMVRPVAIGRKNWMFLGSDNGGKAAAILYSVMASAKANQVEPFAYVRDLLVQFSGKRPDDLSALLPDQWLKMHPDAQLEAKVLIERWRVEYNTIRPHSSLGYHPPAPEARLPLETASATLQLLPTAVQSRRVTTT